ncbi:MAG TPA: prepilin-type N-terminal cleavage/methylation domain-containing protein [Terriglobales bacterium]
MEHKGNRRTRGFSLMELTVAMALGLIVLGAAAGLFHKALDASFLVSQRAQMQQDARAALGVMAKDISLAGAGLPTGGVQLPVQNGATPSKFACDQTGLCYVGNNQYPGNNYLYGVIPNPASGAILQTGITATDSTTVAYTDTEFRLNAYNVALSPNGDLATFTLPNPAPVPAPQAVNDPAVGLKVGDLVLFSNNIGAAIGEVTLVQPGGQVSFANGDALNINQSAAGSGNIAAIAAGTNTLAYRLLVITYYVDQPSGSPPRLMRQLSGHDPVPVGENLSGLQISYDIFDESANQVTSNLKDAGGFPNQIRKVNLGISTRSPVKGTGYQSLALVTSVSARNMSFRDRYR